MSMNRYILYWGDGAKRIVLAPSKDAAIYECCKGSPKVIEQLKDRDYRNILLSKMEILIDELRDYLGKLSAGGLDVSP